MIYIDYKIRNINRAFILFTIGGDGVCPGTRVRNPRQDHLSRLQARQRKHGAQGRAAPTQALLPAGQAAAASAGEETQRGAESPGADCYADAAQLQEAEAHQCRYV